MIDCEFLDHLSYNMNVINEDIKFSHSIEEFYTEVWDLQTSPFNEPGIIDPFFYFLIAKAFLREMYCVAKILCIGGHKSGTVDFFQRNL